MRFTTCLLVLLFLLPWEVNAQALDYNNRVTVILDDGTPVTLYGRAKSRSQEFSTEYFYLPTGLRNSARPDGTPEFLFLKYTTEETEEAGGVQGAIIHFLMEWGLTPEQERELETKLRSKVKGMGSVNSRFANMKQEKVRVLGPVDVYLDDEEPSFRVISATLNDNEDATLITSGKAPVLPGYKAAVAGKLDKNSAQLLAATFEKARSITDISLELNYKYNLLMPAVDGKILVNWSRVYKYVDSLIVDRNDWTWDTKDGREGTVTHDEVRGIYEDMIETKAVIIEIDKLTTEDAVADQVVEEFLNVFMEAIADRDMEDAPPAQKDDLTGESYTTDVSYKISKKKMVERRQQGIQVYHLKYRTTVPRSISLVGNLASWYDHVRHNKKCVASVNLNDPFYEHRAINFILDLEAEEMFGKEVNYVTVNVRKKRSKGNDFSGSLTIDRDWLKKNGIKSTLTYARGEDENPDVYEYKVQWSLKGGNVFPRVDTNWVQGNWQGITLYPPIKPRSIRFEADIEELKDLDIRNVTLQLRYWKFGKEVESNVNLSLYSGEPFTEKTIFTDRNTRGYAYRLVFTHKSKGVMALPWDAKINTDYVFAVVPDELREQDETFIEEMLENGKNILTGGEGEAKGDSVLDKFKDVIINN